MYFFSRRLYISAFDVNDDNETGKKQLKFVFGNRFDAILISHLKYYHNKQYNIELLRSFSYYNMEKEEDEEEEKDLLKGLCRV